jgi:hypothetical protein
MMFPQAYVSQRGYCLLKRPHSRHWKTIYASPIFMPGKLTANSTFQRKKNRRNAKSNRRKLVEKAEISTHSWLEFT